MIENIYYTLAGSKWLISYIGPIRIANRNEMALKIMQLTGICIFDVMKSFAIDVYVMHVYQEDWREFHYLFNSNSSINPIIGQRLQQPMVRYPDTEYHLARNTALHFQRFHLQANPNQNEVIIQELQDLYSKLMSACIVVLPIRPICCPGLFILSSKMEHHYKEAFVPPFNNHRQLLNSITEEQWPQNIFVACYYPYESYNPFASDNEDQEEDEEEDQEDYFYNNKD